MTRRDAQVRRGGFTAVVGALMLLASACGETKESAVTSMDGRALDGRGPYAANCAACHGADLKGTAQGPPLLDAIYRPGHHADAAFLIAVRNGARAHHWNVGPMPPVPGLSDQQVAAITAFVRAEQQAAGIR